MLKSVVLGGDSGTPSGGAIIFGKSLWIVVETDMAVSVVVEVGSEERIPV